MADRISRMRLRKKVLERWENEGGRLADEETSTAENKTSLSDDRAADKSDRSSDEQRKPFHTK